MLNKRFGVIYFQFNIFSENKKKKIKKTGVKICIFRSENIAPERSI